MPSVLISPHSTGGYFLRRRKKQMFALDCILALLAQLPSFLDLIVRHALEILSAL